MEPAPCKRLYVKTIQGAVTEQLCPDDWTVADMKRQIAADQARRCSSDGRSL